ncbi:NosD domain-containing protein [Natronosalvus amylolyticus]|uniref:NosD domain-containing protein n=1 Tax=Natronosalvus amylolyticus TaxID=2961994 RepID=UPI0020C9CB3C|nr:NosD domain-containing protein [Natronosalvus amylolyticus]
MSLGCVVLVAMGGVAAETGAPECNDVDFDENSDGYYEVENLSQLQCLEEHGLEEDYVLVEDIEANETEDWNDGDGFEPIGDGDDRSWVEGNETFNGTFDGNDRTIANLTINRGGDDLVGLFEVIGSQGTVSNLTLESATVAGTDYVGGFSGQNYGTVSNLTLVSATVTGNDDVGGLIGENRGTVSDVSVSTDVAGSGDTGGAIGSNFGGIITGATVEGAVFSKQDVGPPRVGGIVGHHHSGSSIDSSSFTNGTVDGEDENIGGIAGDADGSPSIDGDGDGSPITNSSANGTIGNEDADSVGGLVGTNSADLSDSYSTATVRGNDSVGGIVGDAENSDIERTYAVGEVDGDGDDVGGLVGVANSFDSGFSIEDSYWDTETTGVSKSFDSEGDGLVTDEGGLTTDEMTGANAAENMVGFGFPDGGDRWHAVEDDYPVLSYEDTDPVYGVEITGTNSAIDVGETLEVDATVTNFGPDGDEQSIELLDFAGDEVDTEHVTLESGESIELTLEWDTEEGEGNLDDVTVASENHTDTRIVSVGAGEVIAQCQTIDTEGAYELSDDVEASGECIEIEADGVSLDGNDYTISGSGTGIVVNDHSNVTITNVTLSGLDVGIEMTDLEDATVEHNTVEGSAEDGLVLEDVQGTAIANNTVKEGATSGIHLADTTDTAVENNTLRENDENGVYVVDSEELVISGNEVVDNGEDDEEELSHHVEDAGIYLSGTVDSTLEANNLTANAQAALFLEESSTDNDIVKNSINVSAIGDGKNWNAVRIDDSSGNTISDSIISTGEVDSHSDRPEYFIYVDSAETVAKDNEIDGHARAGIDIRGESNTVDNNSIAGSFHRSDAQNGHAIRVDATGEDWSVTNNSLNGAEVWDDRAGIAITGDQTVEIQNNTGTPVGRNLGTDLKLTNVEQSVENQQLTTPAGETTVTFTGAELRLDGVDESPADHDTVESTGYYFEVEKISDEFTFENLELDYNETRLTTGETIDPETLSLWRLDSGEWEEIDDSGVDTDEQVVTGNVTEDGIIGVFGEEPPLVDITVDDVTVEQGEPLEVDLEDAKDSIGDSFDDESEVMFESDVFDADLLDEPLTKNVTFEDGDASDVKLLDADQTAALSEASPMVEVYIEGHGLVETFDLTVEAVLADFDVADDVAIDQGEPLEVDLENAEDKAGDPYTNTVDLTGDDIDGQELSADAVEFDTDGSVSGIELLEGETTEEISAGAYDDVTIEAAETDVTTQVDVTLEAVLADFAVEDEGIEQGELLTMTVSDAVDLAGDDFHGEETVLVSGGDLEGTDTDVEKTVDFAGTDDVEFELLPADETAGLTAQKASITLVWADDTDVGATSEVVVTAVLNEFAVESTNERIDQGDALTLEVTDAEDVAGDSYTGTVDLTVDDIDGKDASTTAVEISEGVATNVELFDGETPTLAAGSYDDLAVTAQEADDDFDVTIEPVLTTLDVEDATITRGDPLSVRITGAFDLAGDPFEEERETTIGMEDLEGVEDRTVTVSFEGEDTVELTEILDGETTLNIDADTYTLEVYAESADEEFELTVANLFADGDGSADDPYLIEDWGHLDNVRFALDANVTLANDLDADTPGYSDVASESANDGDGFEPIGDNFDAFEGSFDGDGSTISGLYIDRTEEDDLVGLFGRTDGTATIEDVHLENATVRGTSNVGGLVGAADGTIANVSAAVDVEGAPGAEPGAGGPSEIGGLLGSNSGQIDNATAEGSVTVEDGTEIGGLVGYSGGLGGGIGYIADSHATVSVDAENSTNVGGLLGNAGPGGTVSASSATGTVEGEADVGGLVGVTQSEIDSSFATGAVSGTESVGGLVGWNNNGIVEETTANSPVTGDENVGGLVGENAGNVSQSYATGVVDDTGSTIGGLVGYDEGDVSASYWDIDATTQFASAGSDTDEYGLRTVEMTGLNATDTMNSFAFPDGEGAATWHATDDYPVLEWQGTDTFFEVNVTESNTPVEEGDSLEVTANVTNWAGDGDQRLTLTSDATSAELDEADVELASGERPGTVSLTWDTDTGDAGEYTITVSSENHSETESVTIEAAPSPSPSSPSSEPADISVTEATLENTTVLVNDSVPVSATLENNGDEDGEYTVVFYVDGVAFANESTTVEGGSSTTVKTNESIGNVGTYTITADDVEAGNVTVDRPASFDLGAVSFAADEAEPGAAVTLTTTITNSGTLSAERTVTVASLEDHDANETGKDVDTESLTLDGGENDTLEFGFETPTTEGKANYLIQTGDDEAMVNLSVVEDEQPEFTIIYVDADYGILEPGEEERVLVTVANEGDEAGDADVTIDLEGEVQSETLELDPGRAGDAAFFLSAPDDAGEYEYTVSVDETETTETMIVEAPEPSKPDWSVSDIYSDPNTAAPGEDVDIWLTIENDGDRDGTLDVEFYLGEETSEIKTLDIEAGDGDLIKTTLSAPEAEGMYDFGVVIAEGESFVDEVEGTKTVSEGAGDDDDPDNRSDDDADDENDDGQPGFGIAVTLLSLALLIFTIRYRRR